MDPDGAGCKPASFSHVSGEVFVAQTIAVMTIGGKNVVGLNLGSGNDNDPVSLRYNLANTLDVRIFEC